MTRLMHTTALAVGLGIGLAPALAQDQDRPDYGACNTDYGVVDVDGNGKVSPEEARKAAEHEFGRIDRDGDGVVSLVEWRNCAGVSFLKSAFTSDVGANGGGESMQSEGAQAAADGASGNSWAGDKPAGAAANGETMQAGGAKDTGAEPAGNDWADEKPAAEGRAPVSASTYFGDDFEALDLDRSGDLDRAEAAEWSQQSFHDREARGDDAEESALSAEERDARAGAGAFAALDADADGTISKDEWSSQDQARADIRFRKLDGDGDGDLTREEWNGATAAAFEAAGGEPQAGEITVWRFWYFL